jgi:type I restriction-modification system DNA methylase subunit
MSEKKETSNQNLKVNDEESESSDSSSYEDDSNSESDTEELTEQFSQLSHSLTKKLPKKVKKDNGIFFTPLDIITTIYDFISDIKNYEVKNALEPSCGSCQFINFLNKKFDGITIRGVEYNESIFKEIEKIDFGDDNKVELVQSDFTKYEDKTKYDLIIGNPPYFVTSKKNIDKKYAKYIDGRPNIYTIFILHSLKMLSKRGVLAFVLPKSFLNCLYYDKIRKYINEKYKILAIIYHGMSDYIDTEQETCSVIIQNSRNTSKNSKYAIMFGSNTIFNYNIKKLHQLVDNSTTLDAMGFEVNVGKVVWNQVKPLLTNEKKKKTLLIYSGDISGNKLAPKKYSNVEKKNYIDKKGIIEVMLVVNRGYGKGKYKFNYCLLDMKEEYLVENHLICIRHKDEIEKEDLLELYGKIIKSFNDDRTEQFINYYFVNNAINTMELQHILPIFLD